MEAKAPGYASTGGLVLAWNLPTEISSILGFMLPFSRARCARVFLLNTTLLRPKTPYRQLVDTAAIIRPYSPQLLG
ncbi:transcription regulator [Moniliophthora roreri]|nr:transcription regulator [Moniliophthora roreri]